MKNLILVATVAVAGAIGFATLNASAGEPDPCTAAVLKKHPKLEGLKKLALKDAKRLPSGIVRTARGVHFDRELWTIHEVGEGLVSFEAKKGKKKKKKKGKKGGKDTPEPKKYMTCLCGGSDSAPGCQTMSEMGTGDVTCEDTGCENRGCGIAIFGDADEVATTFETL